MYLVKRFWKGHVESPVFILGKKQIIIECLIWFKKKEFFLDGNNYIR